MSFNTPLSSPQYDLLRSGSYAGTINVSFMSGRVVFAGQVNTDLTDPRIRAWWQFAYNNVTVGSYLDIEDGQTIIIGLTNDLKFSALQERLFHGRIRGEATSSIIPVNISSVDIPVGAYFWILDDWEILNRLSRPVGLPPSVTQFKDTTLPYEGLMPRVYGLRTGYAGKADDITGKLRLALSVTGFVEQVGATISSYLWSFRSGIATVISGSLSSAAVTVDIDPSACAEWGETWGTLTVTQSDGVVLVRKFGIKITDEDHPPDVSFEDIQVKAGWQQNYTATLPAFAGVNNILPGTMAILWRSDEFYGTTEGPLTDNNIEFIGWMVNETSDIKGDKDYSTLTSTTFQLAGVGARLAYLIQQLLMIVNDSTPSVWDEIWFANPRRAVWHALTRHSTAGMLCDVNFDVESLTEFYLFPAIPFKGSNVLSICNNLMTTTNGALEFAPDGRIFACRDAEYMSDANFAAIPIIGNFTAGVGANSDGMVISHSVSYDNNIGQAKFFGGMFNGTVQSLEAVAPGSANGESGGTASRNDQILKAGNDINAAKTEVCGRVGTFYEITNFVEKLIVDVPDGYNLFIPSKSEFYTWTIDDTVPGPNGIHRINFDTSTLWFVESVDYAFPANDGTRKNRIAFRRVIQDATPGQIPPSFPNTGTTIPPLTPLPFPSIPGLPPFPELGLPALPPAYKPPTGKITHYDGETVIINTNTNAWITKNYVALASPVWIGITPDDLGSFEIKEVIFDPLGPAKNTCGAYLLASDGTNSAIWYTSNVLAQPPVWTKGDEFSGTYTQIRGAGTPGSVLCYTSTDGDRWTKEFDFTGGLAQSWANWQGAVDQPHDTQTIAAGGWSAVCTTIPSFGASYMIVRLQRAIIASTTLTNARIEYDNSVNNGNYDIGGLFHGIPGTSQNTILTLNQDVGTGLIVTWAGAADIDVSEDFLIQLNGGKQSGGSCPSGAVLFKKITLSGIGTNPFTGTGSSGNAKAILSDDYGATVGSPVTVGTPPGSSSGFDLIRSGGVSYATALNALKKATTLGGSYSAFASLSANAASVCIPYYQVGSNSVAQTTSSSPQVVIGYDAPVSGSCLAWINGSGTITPITNPVSGAFFSGPNRITMLRGTKIAIIVNVAGTEKLYKAENLAADGSATWAFVENVSADATARSRRNDSLNASHKGQLFVFDDPCGYSSKWAFAGEFDRTSPDSGIISGDIYN